MDAVFRHTTLAGIEIRMCARCQMLVTEDGLPDPAHYSAERIERFNARLDNRCDHNRSSKNPTTVDELLLKLDAEYDRLEDDLPARYLAYGRYRYYYPDGTGYQSDKYDIDRKLTRQKEIHAIQDAIRREKEKATA